MSNTGRRKTRALPAAIASRLLDAYRAVRDGLFAKIKTRFGLGGGLSV